MTEDEAKTKWCPTASVPGMTGGKNRDADGVAIWQAHCIGSVCMAWRWVNPDSEVPNGFCGLAGRPA